MTQNYLNEENDEKFYQLKILLSNNNFSEFHNLIKNDYCSINIQHSFSGNSLLHETNQLNQLQFLINSGINVNIQNYLKQTPLHLAKTREEVFILLNGDANLNLKDNIGYTPIELYKRYNYKSILQAINFFEKDKLNKKLFHIICEPHDSILKDLIDQGIDINIQNDQGNTPLHFVMNVKQMKLLLDAGANPNIQNKYGNTPLHTARSIDLMRLLLENGAIKSINSQNIFGNTPLHLPNTIEKTKLLLDAGANPNIQNEDGNTPLICNANRKKTILLLLEAGADPYIKNHKNQIPSDFANKKIFEEFQNKIGAYST